MVGAVGFAVVVAAVVAAAAVAAAVVGDIALEVAAVDKLERPGFVHSSDHGCYKNIFRIFFSFLVKIQLTQYYF